VVGTGSLDSEAAVGTGSLDSEAAVGIIVLLRMLEV
jgi:hypothetical protein